MDSKGRIVIPKQFREKLGLGLARGSKMVAETDDGRIVLSAVGKEEVSESKNEVGDSGLAEFLSKDHEAILQE